MARFSVDDVELSVTIELDGDDEVTDLSHDGAGQACLEIAIAEMQRSWASQRAPDGTPWQSLGRGTIAAKGHSQIGRNTGRMFNACAAGAFIVSGEAASWTMGGPEYARYFHEVRPLVGWTAEAMRRCRELLNR